MAENIARRHVLYVHGYDPDGPAKYRSLFAHLIERAGGFWGAKAELGGLVMESDDVASWTVATSGPNWRVSTQYDMIRYEAAVRDCLGQPVARQLPGILRYMLDDLVTGTTARIFRASARFGLGNILMQVLILLWLGLSVAAGVIAFAAARAWLPGLHWSFGLLLAAAVLLVAFVLLRLIVEHLLATRYNNSLCEMRRYGRGEPTRVDGAIEAGAERLRALAKANAADEIVVVGHSFGSWMSLCIVARALQDDPELGRRGPPIVLMTVGSIIPLVALHPSARRLREAIGRLAVEPSIAWIDCQAHADWFNFANFDPVAGTGVDVGLRRCNPFLWQVRFRDLLPADVLRRMRLKLFRMHFQFIMANRLRAPYDYFILMCGPVAVAEWARRQRGVLARFAADGTLLADGSLADASPADPIAGERRARA